MRLPEPGLPLGRLLSRGQLFRVAACPWLICPYTSCKGERAREAGSPCASALRLDVREVEARVDDAWVCGIRFQFKPNLATHLKHPGILW